MAAGLEEALKSRIGYEAREPPNDEQPSNVFLPSIPCDCLEASHISQICNFYSVFMSHLPLSYHENLSGTLKSVVALFTIPKCLFSITYLGDQMFQKNLIHNSPSS